MAVTCNGNEMYGSCNEKLKTKWQRIQYENGESGCTYKRHQLFNNMYGGLAMKSSSAN